jgi:hypothetical protein
MFKTSFINAIALIAALVAINPVPVQAADAADGGCVQARGVFPITPEQSVVGGCPYLTPVDPGKLSEQQRAALNELLRRSWCTRSGYCGTLAQFEMHAQRQCLYAQTFGPQTQQYQTEQRYSDNSRWAVAGARNAVAEEYNKVIARVALDALPRSGLTRKQ